MLRFSRWSFRIVHLVQEGFDRLQISSTKKFQGTDTKAQGWWEINSERQRHSTQTCSSTARRALCSSSEQQHRVLSSTDFRWTCKIKVQSHHLRTENCVCIALSAKLSPAILEVLLRNTIAHRRYWKLNACKTQILHKTPDKRQHRESWCQLPHISGYSPAQIGEKQTLWQSLTAAFCKANLSPQESCYTRGPKVAQGPSLCSAPSHRGHLVSSFESQHSSTAH